MAASNKECVVIVLDVRQTAGEKFKQKSIKCAAEILKDKICAAKKDYVGFVLLGTQKTFNDVNEKVSREGYLNIFQYPQVQLATWQLLLNYYKFVNEQAGEEGEWLDALVVAMEMLKSSEETFKFQRKRILLFYDFNGSANSYDMFKVITENIMKQDIELIVVSGNIQYIDNPANGEPQAIFGASHKKTATQLENEKYALQLVSNCSALLCNFEEALRTIFKVVNKRPWTWKASLTIGSKIEIRIQGMLAIKDESNIKLKKCWANDDELVMREVKYYIRGNEVDLHESELIEGYMLGGTPVAYDETLAEDKPRHEKGLKFLGFVKSKSIPQEYYTGDSLYSVVHEKGMTSSAKKMDALVRALINTDMAVLCWKIFSEKFNNPKIVVLLPNKLHSDRPATLSMIELTYHAQHHFWDFPTLSTQKTQCSSQQLDAIDNLIDSMDLMMKSKDGLKDSDAPRDTFYKDLLPVNTLPHIYEQNIMDILERKILCNASEDDEQFQEMLEDKNFVECFWKVPEQIEQKAKSAANQVKRLFPLEKSTLPLEKAKARKAALAANVKQHEEKANNKQNDVKTDVESVSLVAPAEDFSALLEHNVKTLQGSTLRDAKFQFYAAQMRTAIWQLIFETLPPSKMDFEKIGSALRIYMQSCYDFNAFEDYNKWMRALKVAVTERKLFDFWSEVIVKRDLGLCVVGETSQYTLDEKMLVAQFYRIEVAEKLSADAADEMDDSAVDELLLSHI